MAGGDAYIKQAKALQGQVKGGNHFDQTAAKYLQDVMPALLSGRVPPSDVEWRASQATTPQAKQIYALALQAAQEIAQNDPQGAAALAKYDTIGHHSVGDTVKKIPGTVAKFAPVFAAELATAGAATPAVAGATAAGGGAVDAAGGAGSDFSSVYDPTSPDYNPNAIPSDAEAAGWSGLTPEQIDHLASGSGDASGLSGVASKVWQAVKSNPTAAAQLGLSGLSVIQGAQEQARANALRDAAVNRLKQVKPVDLSSVFADPYNPYRRVVPPATV